MRWKHGAASFFNFIERKCGFSFANKTLNHPTTAASSVAAFV
jgi:hypothetical protein